MSGYAPGAMFNRNLVVGVITAFIMFGIQSCTREKNPDMEAVSTTENRSVSERE